VALLIWWRSRASAATAPAAVAGVVTSGSRSVVIDTNVLSPTFGLAIDAPDAPPPEAAASIGPQVDSSGRQIWGHPL
jgi:hypothetical protein